MLNDVTNHPQFAQRLKNWKTKQYTTSKSTCVNAAEDPDCGLTDDEIACYSSHELSKLRTNVDANLREIYQPETSRANMFNSGLETTMLTGIIWAMLGTTVLYYAFTKI
jgi:hypothetical protein